MLCTCIEFLFIKIIYFHYIFYCVVYGDGAKVNYSVRFTSLIQVVIGPLLNELGPVFQNGVRPGVSLHLTKSVTKPEVAFFKSGLNIRLNLHMLMGRPKFLMGRRKFLITLGIATIGTLTLFFLMHGLIF